MEKGIFATYKPKGITSHAVVNKVRKLTGQKRVGHGGTLDPMAEGVLVIAVGRENTKRLEKFVKGEKEYEAEITLGATSDTDDAEGAITNHTVTKKPTQDDVTNVLKQFLGKISQTPPLYSSIKIKGKPAHRRMRKGENVELKPRTVIVKNIKLNSYEYPILKMTVSTGPGVYIRSIARDVGKELDTGAYLSSLKRTRVGNFAVKEAIHLFDTDPQLSL